MSRHLKMSLSNTDKLFIFTSQIKIECKIHLKTKSSTAESLFWKILLFLVFHISRARSCPRARQNCLWSLPLTNCAYCLKNWVDECGLVHEMFCRSHLIEVLFTLGFKLHNFIFKKIVSVDWKKNVFINGYQPSTSNWCSKYKTAYVYVQSFMYIHQQTVNSMINMLINSELN